jgi:riboflavin biosynthesis pyrimidine reductase
MRALLPTPAADVDVHEFYATDWLDRGGVRAVFVASVDGAAWAQGRSAGLQTPGDNRVFHAMRDLADVVLVGSGTAKAERYGAVVRSARTDQIRRRYGFRPELPIAVLSRSLDLDPGSSLFDPGAAARTIVLTCVRAPADRLAALADVADVVVCGEDDVDPLLARAALENRSLHRIAAEGGPHAFAMQVAAGMVDELCLSVTPKMVGPGPARIVGGAEWTLIRDSELIGLLEEDGALFARYRLI